MYVWNCERKTKRKTKPKKVDNDGEKERETEGGASQGHVYT